MTNFTALISQKYKQWLLIAPLALMLTGCGNVGILEGVLPGTVTADQVEEAATQYYAQEMAKSNVLPAKNAVVVRVRGIANRLIPLTPEYNPKAANWKWEVNVINDPKTLNAWCMAGGKIAFYTGIINQLKLTDDEIAIVMGHEMVHALKEHVYYQINKEATLGFGVSQAGKAAGVNTDLAAFGEKMLNLTFSRDDEKTSDLIGQELAARAGFNPQAAVTLWKKMQAATGSAASGLADFFSTHPNNENRVQYLEENLKNVMPLYEEAKRNARRR
ncbi:MAG: M48 family metallopeptidase [Saezia sp.]